MSRYQLADRVVMFGDPESMRVLAEGHSRRERSLRLCNHPSLKYTLRVARDRYFVPPAGRKVHVEEREPNSP